MCPLPVLILEIIKLVFEYSSKNGVYTVNDAARNRDKVTVDAMEVQGIRWTGADLAKWRKRCGGMTQGDAGMLLGITLRAYSDRERDRARITRETEFACLYIEGRPELWPSR